MNFKRFHESKNLFNYQTGVIGGITSSGDIGTNQNIFVSDYIEVMPSTKYTSTHITIANYGRAGAYYDENKEFISAINNANSSPDGNTNFTYSTPNNCKYMRIATYIGITDYRQNIMLNTGSTALPYEPYGDTWLDSHYIMGTSTDTLTTLPADIYANATTATVGLKGQMEQSGTPTPTTPIQPSECGERTGNLLRLYKSGYRYDNSGNEVEYPSTNIYAFSAKETKTYTINWSYPAGIATNTVRIFGFYQGNPVALITVNINVNSVPYTFTTDVTIDEYRISVSNQVYDMIANEGDTPLPYEPYGVKIPILNNSQTTNVYLGEVQTTRKIKKLVLTGEENWGTYTLQDSSYCAFLSVDNFLGATTSSIAAPIMCSHYEVRSQNNIYNRSSKLAVGGRTNQGLLFVDIDITSETEWKNYLAQQYAAGTPVTVWYVLAESATGIVNEPLRKIGDYADEVSGITIPTTAGANAIDALTTLKPSEVSVNYHGWHPVQNVHERENGQWD